MKKNSIKIGSLIVAILFAAIIASPVFAATTVNTPAVKYLNNKTVTADDAVEINAITLKEANTSSFDQSAPGGKVTIKLPSNMTIAAGGWVPENIRARRTSTTGYSGNNVFMALSTDVFGSSTTPHNIYLATSATHATGMGVLFIYHTGDDAGEKENAGGSAVSLFRVYRAGAGAATSNYMYGSSATYNTKSPFLVNFSDLTTTYDSKGLATNGKTAKVGEIYYDATNKQVVMTLAALGQSISSLETMVLEGLRLIPANTSGTGDQALTLVDGNAAGTSDLFGITGADVKVANLVNTMLNMEGAAGTTSSTKPPLIPGGSTVIEGQGNGRIKFTVTNTLSAATDNKITISLDNGAKFHESADDTDQLAGSSGITIGTTSWDLWMKPRTGESIAVDSNGKLVISLGTHSSSAVPAQTAITIPRSTTSKVIDTSGLTASGDITATASGSGTDFVGFSGTAVIADGQLKGVTVAFQESAGATDFDTYYAGRTAQTTSDKVRITESSQGSLFGGGTIVFTLDQSAKFTASTTLSATEETSASPYKDSELAIADTAITTASTTGTGLVSTASSTNPGRVDYSGFSFDLSNATAGDLTLTVGGTAGASGTMTLGTIINATTATISDTVNVVPGQSINIPTITITEVKKGALAAGKIGLKFPTGFTLDDSSVSLTVTEGTSTSSNVSWDDVDTGEASYAYFSVSTASATGAYTIVISGLTATTASTTSSSSLIVAGASSGTWSSDNSTFNGDTGAKPTKETLSLGTLVSTTVPTLSPATGVPVSDVITQTLTVAGGNFDQVGDIYVFTTGSNAQYYDGTTSTWSSTEAAYESGATLGTHTVIYDVSALGTAQTVYVGYGVGYSGTVAQMNSDATFAAAYTTASSVDAGKDAGTQNVEFNADDNIELYLNITNDDGVAYTDIVAEWMLLGAIINGTDWGLAFFTDKGELTYLADALAASSDLSTVTYAFDHSADTALISSLSMSSLGLTTGDQFYYGYLYSTTGFDGTDGSFVIENVTFITVK